MARPPTGKKYDPLRPLGARALKSVRDTLRPYFAGARVLDLYGGQGRFGIAAIEEQAAEVLFVESHPRTARELATAVARYGARARVVTSDVFAFLFAESAAFDIVFADPPFADWSPDLEAKLFQAVARVLPPDGIFLVKHPSRMVLSGPKPRFRVWKRTAFGESELAYFNYADES